MKKLLFLILCFIYLRAEGSLLVNTSSGSDNYNIIDITQIDFSESEDILYIHSAESDYSYSILEIESIEFDGELSVTELEHITNITSFSLFQNYPNPFNPKTNITFELNQSGRTSVDIFNVKGQLVKTLIDNHLYGGKHNVVWDGSDAENKQVGSAMYFYRVTVNGQQYSKQMIMLK